jgi:Arm domain-containing DNA-binding protein
MAGKEKMTARAVAAAKPGRYCDGRGLWLVVSPSGGLQVHLLGPGQGTSIAEAHKKADEARKIVAEGKNPIETKGEARMASAAKIIAMIIPSVIQKVAPYWSYTPRGRRRSGTSQSAPCQGLRKGSCFPEKLWLAAALLLPA